jgi:hydroxypyruvate isomerase
MLRFAANLTMMYNEVPFLERFDAAADDGFQAVEFLFPYEHSADEIAARLQDRGLTQALFNLPPGNWAAGDRGMACLPERCDEFKQTVEAALPYALATGVRSLHIMAGITPSDADPAVLHRTYIDNLRLACDCLGEKGITVMIEPLNGRDMPGYFLTHQAQAHAVCAEVARPNIKVQMDLYHCQIVEGDLATKIQQYFSGIGHIQIASVPQRHEPDEGEVNYKYLFGLLESLGYAGYVGCEYRPRQGTSAGLGWWRQYTQSANAIPK